MLLAGRGTTATHHHALKSASASVIAGGSRRTEPPQAPYACLSSLSSQGYAIAYCSSAQSRLVAGPSPGRAKSSLCGRVHAQARAAVARPVKRGVRHKSAQLSALRTRGRPTLQKMLPVRCCQVRRLQSACTLQSETVRRNKGSFPSSLS